MFKKRQNIHIILKDYAFRVYEHSQTDFNEDFHWGAICAYELVFRAFGVDVLEFLDKNPNFKHRKLIIQQRGHVLKDLLRSGSSDS